MRGVVLVCRLGWYGETAAYVLGCSVPTELLNTSTAKHVLNNTHPGLSFASYDPCIGQ